MRSGFCMLAFAFALGLVVVSALKDGISATSSYGAVHQVAQSRLERYCKRAGSVLHFCVPLCFYSVAVQRVKLLCLVQMASAQLLTAHRASPTI